MTETKNVHSAELAAAGNNTTGAPPERQALKIYLAAFPTGGGSGRVHGSTPGGDVIGNALAEDGIVLATHVSSSLGFAKHDMGLTSDWKHEYYQLHAPNGYELEWVDDPASHAGWQAALVLNRAELAKAEGREP